MEHAHLDSTEAPMTRPPERFRLDRLGTPIGIALVVTDHDGVLRALDWDDYEPRMRRLLGRYYGVIDFDDSDAPGEVRRSLADYFAGDLRALDAIAVRTAGTPFQRAVWAALRTIRPGHTLSYSALAVQIGAPKAVRAVGLANGANPISVVVPCHRVIGADGSLTGYGGGLDRKRWLLEHESRDRHSPTTADQMTMSFSQSG
jgi:methylated-DNA-[protein]-cysteine S-methyltransferase